MAQSGSALGWGPSGRWFKSSRPDFTNCGTGVHYMWTRLGLEPRVIAAQAGWDIKGVEKLLKVYGHGEVGALAEVDAAFAKLAPEDTSVGLRAIEGGRGVS